MSKLRSSRIRMPGATRITLTGILAVSDDFDRVRLLIFNKKNSIPDNSLRVLQNAIPSQYIYHTLPYMIDADFYKNQEDVQATVVFVLPAHRKKYWLEVAESLRGQWVSIEATLRPFDIKSLDSDNKVIKNKGISLDLSLITPCA